MSDPVTGLEFVCGIPESTKKTGAFLHKLHLDKLMKWSVAKARLLAFVDDVQHEVPIVGDAQVIPCSAGEHEVTCALKSWAMLDAVAQTEAMMYERATLKVRVDAGQIVTVRYMHNNFTNQLATGANANAHLEIVGTRPG